MNSHHILILSESTSFPWGMAATSRIKSLAKGMQDEGFTVEHLSLRGADVNSKHDKKHAGIFEGIPYRYPGMIAFRPSNWWLRRVDDTLGVIGSILYVLLKKITQHIDIAVLYSRNPCIVSFWTHFFHFLKTPVVLEVCEWPLAIAATRGVKSIQADRYCYQVVPLVDAVLPISTYIQHEIELIAQQTNKKIPSFIIPILIDSTPHHVPSSHKQQLPYLLYSGAIAYMDIACIVIDTLHELKKLGHILPVKFTGKEDKTRFEELRQYAHERGVLTQLEFTGFIDESILHELMQGAVALLAPLPDNLQSKSRFSTKIGYYLASGTPIVTTAIGDVNVYLTDGENAFVAEKCHPADIAVKIQQIIKNPELAQTIGEQGQKLAFEKFHYSQACKGLGDFFHQIENSYH